MNIENGSGNTAVGGHAGQFIGNGAEYNTLIGFGVTMLTSGQVTMLAQLIL